MRLGVFDIGSGTEPLLAVAARRGTAAFATSTGPDRFAYRS